MELSCKDAYAIYLNHYSDKNDKFVDYLCRIIKNFKPHNPNASYISFFQYEQLWCTVVLSTRKKKLNELQKLKILLELSAVPIGTYINETHYSISSLIGAVLHDFRCSDYHIDDVQEALDDS